MILATSSAALVGFSILLMFACLPIWGRAMRDGGVWGWLAVVMACIIIVLWIVGVIRHGHS